MHATIWMNLEGEISQSPKDKYCMTPCIWSISVLRTKDSLSCVQLFATPWALCSPPGSSVHGILQARLPLPSPGDLPNPGIKPRSPALQADTLTSEPPGVKFIETENRIVVARGWGLEEDKELLICNFSFAKWKSFGDWSHNNVNIANVTQLYTWKWLR